MKKTVSILLFALALVITPLSAKQNVIHMQTIQTDKDLYCVFDQNVTFVKKGDLLIKQFVDTQCTVNKSEALLIKKYNDDLIKNSQIKSKAIHAFTLVLFILGMVYINRNKQKLIKYKDTIKVIYPALGLFIIIEFMFVFLNINIILLILHYLK